MLLYGLKKHLNKPWKQLQTMFQTYDKTLNQIDGLKGHPLPPPKKKNQNKAYILYNIIYGHVPMN